MSMAEKKSQDRTVIIRHESSEDELSVWPVW